MVSVEFKSLSKLLRLRHIPYHITIVITYLVRKTLVCDKKNRSFCSTSIIDVCDKKNRSFCSTSIIDKPKKLRLSLRLTLSLKNCFSVSAKQDAPQHSSKAILTLHSAFTVFPPRAGFFHDEIEIPERVTILVIRLSGCLHTSRIIANSVKNSTEFLSLKWGFLGFCLNSNLKPKREDAYKRHPLFLYRGVGKITLRLSPSEPSGLQERRSRQVTVMLLHC